MPCVGQAAGVDQAGRKKEAPESIFHFCGKCLFLAVQDSSIGDLVTQSVSESGFDFSDFRDLTLQ